MSVAVRDDRLERLAATPQWRRLWDRLLQPVDDDAQVSERSADLRERKEEIHEG